MTTLQLGLSSLVLLMFFLGFGIPVAISLFITGAAGLWYSGGSSLLLATFRTLPFGVVSDYQFVVLPMFILMGIMASKTGMVSELYTAAYRWMSRFRGNLYMTTTLASAGFAAISGSTVVNAVVFTRMALPEMLERGYSRRLSAGCIAAAGTFAALIPPSIILVIYAVMTGVSVGQLLMAGIVPGLLTAGIYIVAIPMIVRMFPTAAPIEIERFSFRSKLLSIKPVWALAILILIVVGGIYGGFLFPSSAATVGAAGVFFIGLARLRLSSSMMKDSLRETASVTGMIFLILIGGLVFSRFLVMSGIVADLEAWLEDIRLGAHHFMIFVVLIYLVLGMLIDSMSIMIITMPIMFPIVTALGIDPIWFGIIVVKLIEVSTITPPVGLNLFAVLSASDGKISARDIYIGVTPFIVLEVLILALLIGYPEIVLWLPEAMSG